MYYSPDPDPTSDSAYHSTILAHRSSTRYDIHIHIRIYPVSHTRTSLMYLVETFSLAERGDCHARR